MIEQHCTELAKKALPEKPGKMWDGKMLDVGKMWDGHKYLNKRPYFGIEMIKKTGRTENQCFRWLLFIYLWTSPEYRPARLINRPTGTRHSIQRNHVLSCAR